jgi:hypothetical protein
MKIIPALLILALSSLVTVFADTEYTVDNVLYVPPEHYVGDMVEARISIAFAGLPSLEPPDALVKNDEITVHGVRIKQNNTGATVVVTFTPFRLGEQTLPPIDLGEFTLQNVPFTTLSLVERHGWDFQGLQDQLLLPGTVLYSILFSSGVVVVLLFVFPGLRIIKQKVGAWAERYTKRVNYKKLMRTITRLGRRLEEDDGKTFYSELCYGVRLYLQKRLACNTISKTTPELIPLLREQLGAIEQEYKLSTIFSFADRVKFGSEAAPVEKRANHLETVGSAADMLEERSIRHV